MGSRPTKPIRNQPSHCNILLLSLMSHPYFEQFLNKNKDSYQIYYNDLLTIDPHNLYHLTKALMAALLKQSVEKSVSNELAMLSQFFQSRYGYYAYYEREGKRRMQKSIDFEHVEAVKSMVCNLLELYHLSNMARKDSVYLLNNLQWWSESPLEHCRNLIDRVTNIQMYLHDLVK